MFTKSAQWYDAIYAWKNYKREAERLHALIQQHARQRCWMSPAGPASTSPTSRPTTR